MDDSATIISDLVKMADLQAIADTLGIVPLGRGRRWCPFCQGDGGGHKTPDFLCRQLNVVSKWKCFRCGQHGDVVDLICRIKNCSVYEGALFLKQWLHGRRAIAPDTSRVISVISAEKSFINPQKLHGIFEDFLAKTYPASVSMSKIYWQARGIRVETLERSLVRFVPSNRLKSIADFHLQSHELDDLISSGMFKISQRTKNPYFPAWQFIKFGLAAAVFPYLKDGLVIGLKLRALIDKTKGDELGVTRFIMLSPSSSLLNYDSLRGANEIIITEGESDYLSAVQCVDQLGLRMAVVCLPGAGTFRPQWVPLFKYKKVYLATDADQAGDDCANRIARQFKEAGYPTPLRFPIPQGEDLNAALLSPTSASSSSTEISV